MIEQALIDEYEKGFDKEEYLVQFIKAHLRTADQKAWLDAHDLSIEDVLNGRTPAHLSAQLERVLFADWNAKLGFAGFGY